MTSKYRYVILVSVAVAAAAIAGLYFAGVFDRGASASPQKVAIDPVRFTDKFVVNLRSDGDEQMHYVQFNVALKLYPMSKDDAVIFREGVDKGGHGGGADETGITNLANYDPLRSATIETASQFSADELLGPDGKKQLKFELKRAYEAVYRDDRSEASDTEHQNPTKPPFHVQDVFLSEFAVQ